MHTWHAYFKAMSSWKMGKIKHVKVGMRKKITPSLNNFRTDCHNRTYWSNIDVTHSSRVDGYTRNAEQISTADPLQRRRVKQTFTQLVLLNS